MLSALVQNLKRLKVDDERLVAEACGDGDLVTALGATAVEDGCTGLGSHANEKAVDLATAAAVGLEGALGHRGIPVPKKCLLGASTQGNNESRWRFTGGC
jgi:hypothetical protein